MAHIPANRWMPLVGGTMLNLGLGTFYSWSVFVLPLEQEFGWVRQQTSWVFSIGILTMAVTFVIAGRLHAIVGFRPLAAIGGVLFSLGFFLSSYTSSLTVLYLAYGLLAGAGNGIGYSIATPVVTKWFPDKRGLAIGIAVDDTIHFLHRWRRERPLAANAREAAQRTFVGVGLPILVTSLVLAAGFLALQPSVVATTRLFGWIILGGLATAVFADLFVLPALLVATDPDERDDQ